MASIRELAGRRSEQEESHEELWSFYERFVGADPVHKPHPEHATQPEEQTSMPSVDLTSPTSPFVTAERLEKRAKVFVWGDSGVGKTWFALHFPGPCVLDLERGAESYGGDFEFDVLAATTANEVLGAVDWLLTNKHDYRTLVIDPITVFWEALQKKWSDIFLRRNQSGKGFKFEYYDMQVKDWNTVKAEFKEFIRKLLALDMNVVVTARQKKLYSDGDFTRTLGETFDGEKSLPYLFDTILRLYRSTDGKFMAETLKDRSRKLPQGKFEVSYEVFEKCWGKRTLGRQASPLKLATATQKEQIERLARMFGMTGEQIEERVAAYGAESLDDLTNENAQVILEKLEAAGRAREDEKPSPEAEPVNDHNREPAQQSA